MPIVEYLNYEVIDDQGWELYDEANFKRAAGMDLPDGYYRFIGVLESQYILEAAEAEGHEWPFSCRDGICLNCVAVLIPDEIGMDGNQALSEEEVKTKDVRLTCIGRPASGYIRLVYNAKHLDYLQDRIM